MQSEMNIVRRHTQDYGVDLEAIFDEFQITLKKEPMDPEVSGSLSVDGNKYTVTVNSNDGPQRQRFTAAHELAHYLMHRHLLGDGQKLHRDRLYGEAAKGNPSVPFRAIHEIQANKLAAEILMPEERLRRVYDAASDNVADVAKRFGVSQAAMKIRLKSLGLRLTAD